MALAGNKADLASGDSGERKVSSEEAQAYADENGLLFLETSAKTAQNVTELFLALSKKMPRAAPAAATAANNTVNLGRQATRKKSSGCC